MIARKRPAPAAEHVHIPQFRSAFLAPRYWPTWLALGLLRVLAWLPWQVRAALAHLIARVAMAGARKRRAIARVNLDLCFPNLDEAARERLLRRHFYLRLRSALDYGLLWWGSSRRIGRLVRVQGEEHLRIPYQAGRAVILLTCHSLMLDFGATVLVRNYQGIGVVKPARNGLVDWIMQRGRQRFLSTLYPRGRGLRSVIAGLRAGAFLYYLPDEDQGDRNTTFAPFFGVPAATLTALSRLARVTDAVVVPAYTRYVEGTGRYEQILLPALSDFPSDDLQQDAARMNRVIEQLIALAPEQYMWTMRRFRTRPDGGPNPYDQAGV